MTVTANLSLPSAPAGMSRFKVAFNRAMALLDVATWPALSITFAPAGTDLVATTVQAALAELDARVTVLETP